MLKPQDVLIVLKLQAIGNKETLQKLSSMLGLSASQVHASMQRLKVGGLVNDVSAVQPRAVYEMLLALRYFMPAEKNGLVRGIPTAYAAPPLSNKIVAGDEPPPVWSDAEGTVKGMSISPIHKVVPVAIKQDPVLYEYLALVDALRIGRAREVQLARDELKARFGIS
jgi:biotin operon repressor